MPAAYEIRAGGDVKNKKQSMADLKLRRLNELNSRLKEDLERPRIKVSEASMSYEGLHGTLNVGFVQLPRVTIKFCTQCKWMLRAAYFAQELLSTFSTSLGEVALIPSTGGIFTVDIVHTAEASNVNNDNSEIKADSQRSGTQTTRLWDRKSEGGFPEVKHLKQLVRNIIDPTRDLGHVDRHSNPASSTSTTKEEQAPPPASQTQTSNPPQPLSTEDPKATVPQDLHIAPDPTPGAAVPREEKIVSDESASRKETVTVTDAEAGLGKAVQEARGG
ncbi:hypothetical protein G7Y79_00001g001730 [Physcia stellaris]|nr:hypothetical protein G7Y79_00001g001730 [Physcia stellaris]